MQYFTVSTRADLEALLADASTHTQALAYLQALMDEQYGYDTTGAWGLVGGSGLERLGITRSEAVAMGAVEQAVAEPAFDLVGYKALSAAQLELARDAVLYATFTDANGVTWSVRGKDRDLVSQRLLLLTSSLGPTTFQWTDAAGVRQEMTADTFRALCAALATWTDNVFTAQAVAAGAISVATTRAEVDAAVAGIEPTGALPRSCRL